MYGVCILVLFFGVALVQMPSDSGGGVSNNTGKNPTIGLVAILSACMSSGFAGVYFEMMVKTSVDGEIPSIWLKNVQLALFGFFFAIWGVYVKDGEIVALNGFLGGYNEVVWTVIFLQAFGGLVIAAVIKYADNILKGFASSLSIIFSALISYYLGDFTLTNNFVLGGILVLASTMMYTYV